MEFKGTVQGSAARKYTGFTYIKPLLLPLDAQRIYPERVHWYQEYPRFVLPPREQDLPEVDLADYTVEVSEPNSNGRCLVQVFMLPNKYTVATAQRLVLKIEMEYFLERPRNSINETLDAVLRRAFQ